MKGVDISRYQKGLTVRQIRDAGNSFAIIKVTEGARLVDSAAFDFYREAYETGFPAGCYCYSHAVTTEDAGREARFLLETIRRFPMPCGIFLDMEEPKQLGLAPEEIRAIVGVWCDEIGASGYTPGIYGSEHGIWAKLRPEDLPAGCLAWVAHYGRQPEIPCDLWQSGNTGRIDGVTVDTDEARSGRFSAMAAQGFGEKARPEVQTAAKAAALLAEYLQTPGFTEGFLDYVHRSEAKK